VKFINLWRENTNGSVTFCVRTRENGLELLEYDRRVRRALIGGEYAQTESLDACGTHVRLDLLVLDDLQEKLLALAEYGYHVLIQGTELNYCEHEHIARQQLLARFALLERPQQRVRDRKASLKLKKLINYAHLIFIFNIDSVYFEIR
jgi:hypothetical protein